MLNDVKKRMKIIKTCNLYLCYLSIGMVTALIGPCLLDLQRMVGTDTHHIAVIYTARSLGSLFGSLIGGVLLDLIQSKLTVLTISNLLATFTVFGIPWCRNVQTLIALGFVNGFCFGVIGTGSNAMCLKLWGKDSNPVFQGLHFTFSIGGFLSPLIAAPFLENIEELSTDTSDVIYKNGYLEELVNSTGILSNVSSDSTHFAEKIPNVFYPFSIVGSVLLLVSLLHTGVCIISPIEDESSKDTSKIDNSERGFLFMFFTAVVSFMIFFVVAGSEIGYGQTLTIFSVKSKLGLTTAQGSYITSTFWGSFMISRFLCIFLSIKVSCLKLLIGDICLIAIAAVILLFFMPNEWALWLASVIFGTGIASVYGAIVGWINTYINISNKFSAVFSLGCSIGVMVIPFLITYFIDTAPEILSFVIAATPILLLILLFMLYCIFRKDRKIKVSRNKKCYVVNVVEAKN